MLYHVTMLHHVTPCYTMYQVNAEYAVCPSYPGCCIVPATVTDTQLEAAARYHVMLYHVMLYLPCYMLYHAMQVPDGGEVPGAGLPARGHPAGPRHAPRAAPPPRPPLCGGRAAGGLHPRGPAQGLPAGAGQQGRPRPRTRGHGVRQPSLAVYPRDTNGISRYGYPGWKRVTNKVPSLGELRESLASLTAACQDTASDKVRDHHHYNNVHVLEIP